MSTMNWLNFCVSACVTPGPEQLTFDASPTSLACTLTILFIWLFDRLICSIGQLIWFLDLILWWMISRYVDWLIWSIAWSDYLIDWWNWLYRLISWFEWSIDWLVYCLIDFNWSINLINWLIDTIWMIDHLDTEGRAGYNGAALFHGD